jgi:type IV secretory pathway TraG/TraD family ATPase VirD4
MLPFGELRGGFIMRSGLGELITEVNEVDQQGTVPLGTAQWMGLREATQRLGMPADNLSDRLWIGEAFDAEATTLGYTDDRHVTLISGTRGGKGAGVIVPNLCRWRGSCIVIDPKGENATVTARRRGGGSDYTDGMGQEVRILDPFGEVPLASSLKARFNPLDVIDPDSDLAVDDAGRIAAAIIVRESKNDPFWEDAARGLVKGLILHVLTFPSFKDIRNLVTVRKLLMEGDWLGIEAARAMGVEKLPTPFAMLWQSMIRNKAYGGVVSGVGEQMFSMADKSEKTLSGILEQARTSTVFLDGAPMRRLLEKSDFDLAAIKTSPRGLTIYLTLPQRYMDTHFRWLRLMVTLALGEMERIKGRPKTGHPTLFLLDEFPGLKRMEVIENAVAQAAGFGVKFFFVTQNLPQLKHEYDENWETFVSNSGLKIFFQVDDHFSREYLSNLLGEREVRRESLSGSDAQSTSTTEGTSSTNTSGRSDNRTFSGLYRTIFGNIRHESESISSGSSFSDSHGTSQSTSQSNSKTGGWSLGVHKRPLLSPDEIGRFLSRIDDKSNPAYPGLILALTPGQHPLPARRINYFESPKFEGCFDPHPDHPPPLTLAELADRNARRVVAQIPLPKPKPVIKPEPFGLWDKLRLIWMFLTSEQPVIGGAVVLGVIVLVVIAARHIPSSPASITSGSAVVDNAPKLNLRNCAAANCGVVATLNKGDPVTVTKSYDNGWKAVTVRYDDGTTVNGFVNGDFLSRR